MNFSKLALFHPIVFFSNMTNLRSTCASRPILEHQRSGPVESGHRTQVAHSNPASAVVAVIQSCMSPQGVGGHRFLAC